MKKNDTNSLRYDELLYHDDTYTVDGAPAIFIPLHKAISNNPGDVSWNSNLRKPNFKYYHASDGSLRAEFKEMNRGEYGLLVQSEQVYEKVWLPIGNNMIRSHLVIEAPSLPQVIMKYFNLN